MSYFKENREVLLGKAYDKYHNKGGKERAKKYYQENKEGILKKERLKYCCLHKSNKEKIMQRSLDRYYKMKSKGNLKMNKLIFDNIEFGNKFPEVNKKQFYESKKAVKLGDVDVNKIVVSN